MKHKYKLILLIITKKIRICCINKMLNTHYEGSAVPKTQMLIGYMIEYILESSNISSVSMYEMANKGNIIGIYNCYGTLFIKK